MSGTTILLPFLPSVVSTGQLAAVSILGEVHSKNHPMAVAYVRSETLTGLPSTLPDATCEPSAPWTTSDPRR